VEVPQVKDGAATQGTPVQFSNAAFFQRTFISSTLNEAFLFISLGDISFDNNSPAGFSPFGFTCAKQITGSIVKSKILIFILCFFKYVMPQI
jgi:hypothetical protein